MAKKNNTYWQARMAALEDNQYQQGAAYYKDVQKQFREAANDIQMDIERWYRRLAENNNVSYAGAKKLLKKDELDEFHWSVEQYIKAGEENAVDQRWMKELENASSRHHISYLEAMKLQIQQHAELLSTSFEGGMTDFLHKSYGEQYCHTAFEIAKGAGIGSNIAQVDNRTIDALIKKPWAQDGANFSDRIWANKDKLVNNLHTELTQNIIRGADPKQAIDNLAKTMEVSKAQAGRLIMTESAAISSAAQKECFKDLDVERYEILATLDSHTSDICQEMDGKIFEMLDYKVGETAPPFHPHCRSTTIPYFDDEFTEGEERAARNEDTGETYYVPANMKYEEWEKGFVLEKNAKPDIMKPGAVSGALTDKNDPLYVKREKHAQSYYQAVRNSKKSVIIKTISNNTGMSEKYISKVYDHVFMNEYDLYGGSKRFDPDYDMAESFRRLREGRDIQDHDVVLLRHEHLEYGLMNKLGMPYDEAHRLAESKYNYREALDEFKKNRKL